MGVISWIVFGFIAGLLARAIMPGNDRAGCLVTVVLGVVGAFVGGWIATQMGWGTVDGFDLRSFGIAILGALVILGIYRLVARR
jgi:Predicted membrane protein